MNLRLRKSDRLKPCPFCGGTDLELNNTHTSSYWIECRRCDAEVHGAMPGGNSRTHHRRGVVSAIKRWNRRVA